MKIFRATNGNYVIQGLTSSNQISMIMAALNHVATVNRLDERDITARSYEMLRDELRAAYIDGIGNDSD